MPNVAHPLKLMEKSVIRSPQLTLTRAKHSPVSIAESALLHKKLKGPNCLKLRDQFPTGRSLHPEQAFFNLRPKNALLIVERSVYKFRANADNYRPATLSLVVDQPTHLTN
jgi:hypothetical protein